MKYVMSFSYDGNDFKGFQRQKNLKTVQGEIEKVLSNINNEKVSITSCGRTDTGVHAKKSVAHFELNRELKLYNLKKVLNRSLNNEIYIYDIKYIDDNFNARYDCHEKEYRYYINIGEYNLFMRNYIYQYNKKLDIDKMKKALSYLVGEHDFRSFCSDDKEKENCVRTITEVEINEKDTIIEIVIKGNGFLKHMIRNIVGYLIVIGNEEKSSDYIKEVLEEKTRKKAIKPAPSCGLYLWNEKYQKNF